MGGSAVCWAQYIDIGLYMHRQPFTHLGWFVNLVAIVGSNDDLDFGITSVSWTGKTVKPCAYLIELRSEGDLYSLGNYGKCNLGKDRSLIVDVFSDLSYGHLKRLKMISHGPQIFYIIEMPFW